MAVGSHSKFTQVNSLVARDPVTPSSGFAHVKMPASRSHFSISCCQHIAHSLEKAVWACVSSAGAFQPNAPALVFWEATGLPSCFFHAASRYNCLLCGPVERRSFTHEHHGDCTHPDTPGRCL